MSEVITWLESPEGEAWSRRFHANEQGFTTMLISVKDDTVPDDDVTNIIWYP